METWLTHEYIDAKNPAKNSSHIPATQYRGTILQDWEEHACYVVADRKGDDDGPTGICRFRESAGRIESFTGLFHAARSSDRTVPGGGSTKFRDRTSYARSSRVTGLPFNRSPRTKECSINEFVLYTLAASVRTCRQREEQWRVDEKGRRREGAGKIARKLVRSRSIAMAKL